ncbi:MAG: CotS family spore coat protein [Firmicutes bacterium]|nr:CotS family spore coat protein [Bacillota bacterium]
MLFRKEIMGKFLPIGEEAEMLAAVEENYNLEIMGFMQDGSVYLLATSMGQKALKRSSLSAFELAYITDALAYLAQTGFQSVVDPLMTKDGTRFFTWRDSQYFLSDWVLGRHCDYLYEQDAETVARDLARLHVTSRNLNFNRVPDTRWLMGMWPERFARRLDQLKAFRRTARNRTVPQAFDQLFLKDYETYYKQGADALEQLADSDYGGVCQEDSAKVLCHMDLAYHNILINGQGVKFLDFDYSLVDLGLHDLADLLLRNLMLVDWRWERAQLIIDAYSSVNPLKGNVLPILGAFLQFPHEYWQIGLQYYHEKQDWPQDYFLSRYNRKLKSPVLRSRFLNTFNLAAA